MAEANVKGDAGRTPAEQRQAGEQLNEEVRSDSQDYDQSRLEEVKAANESEDLGNGFTRVGGVVRAGTSSSAVTQFPGAEQRDLGDTPEGEFLRGVVERRDQESGPSVGWTAQSANAYNGVEDGDPSTLPGQTFSVEELPDPEVVKAAGLPYAIPANLVLEGNVTDNISSAQERAGTQTRGDGQAKRGKSKASSSK